MYEADTEPYLLSDADVAKLVFVEKQTPRHKEFSAMKMLLVSQVGTAAACCSSSGCSSRG